MLTTKPGEIAEALWLLGENQSLAYLVKGTDAMLIGGAMSWIAPRLDEQFVQFGIDPGCIKYLVIQHSHFDHCGVVPYLKRRYPWIRVLATASAKSILSKPKVISYINLVNSLIIDVYGMREQYDKMNLAVDEISVDHVIDDDSVIDLGRGVVVRFMETPGHSPCAVSVYIPVLKAVFPTDSAPCPVGSIDRLARPSPQFDFGLYKRSLEKLLECDIGICGFDHYAAVTGVDARKVLVNGLAYSLEYAKRIVGLYRENGDFESIARLVAKETMEADKFDFMSEDLMMPISRAEVRNILKAEGITVS